MYRTLSEKFYKDMAESYFHPTRKYPSENVKFLAQLAMLYLWNVPGITLWGKEYDRDFIRKWIINEMTVADLDRAIDEAVRRQWKMSLRGFAEIIFRSVLYSDSIAKAEVERDFPTSIFKREKESGSASRPTRVTSAGRADSTRLLEHESISETVGQIQQGGVGIMGQRGQNIK